MRCRLSELRYKEIVNIENGVRFGFTGDVELDLVNGKACALIVPGRPRFFGLFGRGEDHVFPWECIKRFGEDIILVEQDAAPPVRPPRERKSWF
ncbi:MAG: YlmC/YmxH family sporulation protein [Oscillospiraceae bacterium]|nr:YlmC/YmxH family sporulation protein [Oscillospiraceae bacterium]